MSLSVVSKPTEVQFNRYVAAPPKKLNLSIDSMEKAGKTRFALTAPGPTAYHDFDFGLNGVADKFPDLELYPFDYSFATTLKLPGTASKSITDYASEVWQEFVTNLRASIDRCKTIVIDSGSSAWPLLRLARLGKLTQVMPIQYTAVNQEFQALCQMLHRSDANILWLHRLKEEYKDDKKTGGLVRQGFGDIAFEVDAVMRLLVDENKADDSAFTLQFGACRPNRLLQRKEITGTDISFAKVAALMYPSTKESDWL
jgi:hypothetical protein